jgi:hypothetical protein
MLVFCACVVIAGYAGGLAMCMVSDEEVDDDSGFGPVMERREREGGCIADVEVVDEKPVESRGLSKSISKSTQYIISSQKYEVLQLLKNIGRNKEVISKKFLIIYS